MNGAIKTPLQLEQRQPIRPKEKRGSNTRKWDHSPSRKQRRYVKKSSQRREAMPVCDKASWRLKPESQLPDIFTREVNECEDLLVAVRDKVKTQKVNENLEFFKRATRASMIISQCYRRYLFQTKIRHRVYVSKISKIQNRWRRSKNTQ